MKMKFIDVKEDLMDRALRFSMTRGEKEMFINCERNKYECFGLVPGEIYEVSKYYDPEGLYDAYIEFDDFSTISPNLNSGSTSIVTSNFNRINLLLLYFLLYLLYTKIGVNVHPYFS